MITRPGGERIIDFFNQRFIPLFKKRKEEIKERKYESVGTLRQIIIYPFKGLRGINVQEALVTHDGLQVEASPGTFIRDHQFMIVAGERIDLDAKTKDNIIHVHENEGNFLTLRHLPKLAKISVAFGENGTLILQTPNMPDLVFNPTEEGPIKDVVLWDSKLLGVDQGNEISKWLNDFFMQELGVGLSVRVVALPQNGNLSNYEEKFVPYHTAGGLTDGSPLSILTTGSIERVRARTGNPDISVLNFRPQVVYEVYGNPPFIEELLKVLQIGEEVQIGTTIPGIRCAVPGRHPRTGDNSHKGLITYFAKERYGERSDGEKGTIFAVNAQALREGKIAVGMPIYVLKSSSDRGWRPLRR